MYTSGTRVAQGLAAASVQVKRGCERVSIMMCIFSVVVMLPLKHTTVTLNLAFLNLLEALTDCIFLQMFRLEDMKAEENAL